MGDITTPWYARLVCFFKGHVWFTKSGYFKTHEFESKTFRIVIGNCQRCKNPEVSKWVFAAPEHA